MLRIATYLAPSPIHGIGLFATDFIPKGALVWKFDECIDRIYSVGAVERMSPLMRSFIDHYASYIRPDMFLFCGDDARFVNHSADGNIREVNASDIDCDDFAMRDIRPGEEITEDYTVFHLTWAPGQKED